MSAIRLLGCFRKPAASVPMASEKQLFLESGIGIEGDANAQPASPRQVLIADALVYDRLELPRCALRENLLVDGLEHHSLCSGDLLVSDSSVTLRITLPCEPCVRLNGVRPKLAREVLNQRGLLARVVRGGTLYPDTTFRVARQALTPLPHSVKTRVHYLLDFVPRGQVATFTYLAMLAGLHAGYARAMPRLLTNARSSTPVHRVVRTNAKTISEHVPEQVPLLRDEGVHVFAGRVPHHLVWHGDPYAPEEKALSPDIL